MRLAVAIHSSTVGEGRNCLVCLSCLWLARR
jgi:hypothetical protein